MQGLRQVRDYYEATLLHERSILRDDDLQLAYIRKYISGNSSLRILDAGCGNGSYARKLSEYGYQRAYGVDLFSIIESSGFTYIAADLEELPFRDSLFNFVYCNSVLVHIQHPARFFSEISRVMKKESVFILTSHTRFSLFTMWRRLKLLFGARSVVHLKGATFYSAGQCRRFLKREGFEMLRMDGFRMSAVVYPTYQWVARTIQSASGLRLPIANGAVTTNLIWAWMKSILAYHFIVIARKR